jgi:hypothetical protein
MLVAKQAAECADIPDGASNVKVCPLNTIADELLKELQASWHCMLCNLADLQQWKS